MNFDIAPQSLRTQLDHAVMQTVIKNIKPHIDAYKVGDDSDLGTRFLKRNLLQYETPQAYLNADGVAKPAIELRIWPGISVAIDPRHDRRMSAAGVTSSNWWHRMQACREFREHIPQYGNFPKQCEVFTEHAIDALVALALTLSATEFNKLRIKFGFDLMEEPGGLSYYIPKIVLPSAIFESSNLAEKVNWCANVLFLMEAFKDDQMFINMQLCMSQIKRIGLNPDVRDLFDHTNQIGVGKLYNVLARDNIQPEKPASSILDFSTGSDVPLAAQTFFLPKE